MSDRMPDIEPSHNPERRTTMCPPCGGRGWTTSGYNLPFGRETCPRCTGAGYLVIGTDRNPCNDPDCPWCA